MFIPLRGSYCNQIKVLYDYNKLRVLTYKTIKVMNNINNRELQEINKVIEVLTAYKEGKIVEVCTSGHGWVRCFVAPAISVINANLYRIIDKEENIETYE